MPQCESIMHADASNDSICTSLFVCVCVCVCVSNTQFLPVTVLLFGTAVPARQFSPPHIAALNNTMVISGALWSDRKPATEAILDLSDMEGPLIALRPTGQLYMQYMVSC